MKTKNLKPENGCYFVRKLFSIAAMVILLLASFIPVGNSMATASATTKAKMIDFPVEIYTMHGVKRIEKKISLDEAMKLKRMGENAGKAIAVLHSKNASFVGRMKANAAIDSFLYELKKNELLGEMSIKEVKELITGKYFMKQNSMEMKKLYAMARLFQQGGWEVNAMCGMYGLGGAGIYPYNLILWLLFLSNLIIISDIAFLLLVILDAIPHPTTIGYWNFVPYGFYPQHPEIETWGLFGYKKLEGYELRAITLGFTGSVITIPWAAIAIGFCPFIAMKRVE